jgi:transposase
VAAFAASGLSVRAFWEARGLTERTLDTWRKNLGRSPVSRPTPVSETPPRALDPFRQGVPVGNAFVFQNRRGDRLKILAWVGDGFALDLRRVEAGTFAFPVAAGADAAITPAQLAMIPGGLDPAAAGTRPRSAKPA